MLNPATGFVGKMRTASGGPGSQHRTCACSLPIAQSLDIQMLESAQTASVERDCECDHTEYTKVSSYHSKIPFRCPARECHAPHKCRGHFIDSYKLANLEDCIRACNDNELCKWYTLEKSNDHCLLYEDCIPLNDCDTCATGEKSCSHGYHGRKNILFQTS